MPEAIARFFDPGKQEPGARLPFGIPERDLTESEFEGYPDHVKRSIDSWGVFRKTKPSGRDADTAARLAPPDPSFGNPVSAPEAQAAAGGDEAAPADPSAGA